MKEDRRKDSMSANKTTADDLSTVSESPKPRAAILADMEARLEAKLPHTILPGTILPDTILPGTILPDTILPGTILLGVIASLTILVKGAPKTTQKRRLAGLIQVKRSETDANGKTRRWEEPAYPDKAPDEMVVVSTTTRVLPPNRKAIACLKKVVSGLAPGAEGEPLHTAILAAKEALAEAEGADRTSPGQSSDAAT